MKWGRVLWISFIVLVVIVLGIGGFALWIFGSIVYGIFAALGPTVQYRPYPKAQLEKISKSELVYPGSVILQKKIQNPSPFNKYEVASYVIELPKNISYTKYLIWLSQNTTANGKWHTPTNKNGWTPQALSNYPDQTFQDDKDGVSIQVDSRVQFFEGMPYAKGWSVLQKGTDPNNVQDPNYTVYRGVHEGLVLWMQLTAQVWEGGFVDPGKQPPPPIPPSKVFARIPNR